LYFSLVKPHHPFSCGKSLTGLGTTRDNFDGKPVKDLKYTSYKPRALQTMISICKEMSTKHSLTAIAIVHRLGVVPIGEESILIAVATPHRQAAWKAGEEVLELCKEKVEIWKLEEFTGDEPGVWRANRDGATGSRVDDSTIIGSSIKLAEGETLKTGRPFGFGHGPVVHSKQSGSTGDLP
jgi:molybdopterin synthase catalytic subunit